jgi:hypothetical protein
MIYERPSIYAITHIGIGFIANWFPIVMVIGLFYQFLQYSLSVRFFPFEGKIKYGNSFMHTAVKVAEMGVGFLIAYFFFSKG